MQNTTYAQTPQSSSMHHEILIAVLAAVSSAMLLISIFACCYANKRKRQSETKNPPRICHRFYPNTPNDPNSVPHVSKPNQNSIAEL